MPKPAVKDASGWSAAPTLPAGLYISQARLEDRLVFGRERRLLRADERFCLIPLIADPDRFAPSPALMARGVEWGMGWLGSVSDNRSGLPCRL
jgi:hypothetical protein